MIHKANADISDMLVTLVINRQSAHPGNWSPGAHRDRERGSTGLRVAETKLIKGFIQGVVHRNGGS